MTKKYNGYEFTAERDAVIIARYLSDGPKRLATELGTTEFIVVRRAKELGVQIKTRTLPTFEWTEQRIEVLRARYVTDGPKRLAEELGTTNASVVMKARKLGIEPSSRKAPKYEWTEEMLTKLRQLYPTEGRETLVREIGAPWYVISHKAQSLGIRNLTRGGRSAASKAANCTSCNIHFFDQLNPTNAWVLGFLFADGSITKRESEAVIGVAIKDIGVVEYIKEVMDCQRKLEYRKPSVNFKGYLSQEAVFVVLAGTLLVKRLKELGMMPNKTYRDDPFPSIPDDLLPHFIRGYFDGDGTAFITKEDWCGIGFVGSPKFIAGVRDVLVRLAGMSNKEVKLDKYCKTPTSRLLFGAREDIRKFRDFIYPAGYGFCLERKKIILDNWLRDD